MKQALLICLGIGWLIACKPSPKAQNQSGTGLADIDQVSALIKKSPKDASLYIQRARLFMNHEGNEEAVQDCQQAIALDSLQLDYHFLLSDALTSALRSRDGLHALYKAVEIFPDSISAKLRLSKALIILKQNERSLEVCNSILNQDPTNTKAMLYSALALRELGDTTLAISGLQRLVREDPYEIDGWLILGNIQSQRHNPIALRYYDNALKVDSMCIPALHGKAIFYQNRQQWKEALQLYDAIIVQDKNYKEAYLNSGLLYQVLDSLERAERQFSLAVQVEPTYGKAWFQRGLVREKLGKPQDALQDFEQAIRFEPSMKEAHQGIERLGVKKR